MCKCKIIYWNSFYRSESVNQSHDFPFVFWLHPPKTWLTCRKTWNHLSPLTPAKLYNVLICPSSFDDNKRLPLRGSRCPVFCLLHSIPSLFLSFCCLEWIPLQKLVYERSPAAPTDPPWLFSCLLFVALFFVSQSTVPPAMAEETRLHANTHTYSKWHKLTSL